MSGLHLEAAKILENVLNRKTKEQVSLKTLIYENRKIKNVKALYKLVCEILKYRDILQQVIEITQIRKRERKLPIYITYVLIYELLIGHGLKGKTALERLILMNKTSIHAGLERIKIIHKVRHIEDLLPKEIRNPVIIPRYVRVNTLKTTLEETIKWFEGNGWTLVERPLTGYRSLKKKTFCRDEQFDFLLIFPSQLDFHENILYLEGKIILQDKASCIPSFALYPPEGSIVIDACAAPGNKTTLLSALMKNSGSIYAFDIDIRRCELLRNLVTKSGAKNVLVQSIDFLKIPLNESPYCNIEYILLDPSCSGSGMAHPFHILADQQHKILNHNELKELADFQISMLNHALKFPRVRKVVYSTCSIHEIENEDVVYKALLLHPEFELISIMDKFSGRGFSDRFSQGNKCIRTSSQKDETIGFFVACFQRKT